MGRENRKEKDKESTEEERKGRKEKSKYEVI